MATTNPTPTQPVLHDANLMNDLRLKIENIKKSQGRITTSLNTSKDKVKSAIIDGLTKSMNNEDFENNEKYTNWLGNKRNNKTNQKNWLKSLDITEQIELLAEYGIDAENEKGENNWEKIDTAQKNKDITKKAMLVEAIKIINSFNELKLIHKETIKELKETIKEKTRERDKKTKEISDMKIKGNNSVDTDRLTEIKNSCSKLDTEIKNLTDKLDDYEKAFSIYEQEINEAIAEFEENMKEEKIYVGAYEGLGVSTSSTQSTPTNNQGFVQGGYGEIDQRKPSEIAKAMMEDFDNLAPSEINEMIEHTGYGDLLQMSRNLGPLNRKKLRTSMENRLDDRKEGITFYGENNSRIELSLEELKNLRSLEDDKFNLMINMVQHYVDNYESMRVHERREAEKVMEYFKISVLLAESDTNRFGRFMRKFSHEGKRIEELGAELNRFSKKRGIREDKKWLKNQSLRDMLDVRTKIPSTERKKHIDRSGKKPIQKSGQGMDR